MAEPSAARADRASTEPPGSSWGERIGIAVKTLASQLERDDGPISAGDSAELRRGWDQPRGAAFWRIAVRVLERHDLLRDVESEIEWTAILAGLAETASLHAPSQRFGRALAAAGVTEARLLRLLRAEDETLRKTLRAVVRQLASAGQRFDWGEPARLLLVRDKDPIRSQIAKSYYRSSAQGADQTKEEE